MTTVEARTADEINPIEVAARKIRATVSQFVTQDLSGVFPRNYEYMAGDYEQIFVLTEGEGNQYDGFFANAHMITLDPDGIIRSGDVKQRVESSYSAWEFSEARLQPAADMEVIRYASLLVTKLFGQIIKELPEESDIDKIGKWLAVLSKQGELYIEVFCESQQALREMGEEEPQIPSRGDQDYGILAMEALKDVYRKISGQKEKTLRQMGAAYELYTRREKLATEVRDLAQKGRVAPVKEWFRNLVDTMKEDDIFPVNVEHEEQGSWSVLRVRSKHKRYEVRGLDIYWYWAVSSEGKIHEFTSVNAERRGELADSSSWRDMRIQDCPEHLLAQAPQIATSLISSSMIKFFPETKKEVLQRGLS